MRAFRSLAFAGLASAALEHHHIAHQARSQQSYVHHRDIRGDNSEPCKILSEVYEAAAKGRKDKTEPLLVDVPPSVGTACLKSVPVDKERDLQLLEYLRPYVSFQSTLEILADPPEEYLVPGVDVLGGFDVIEQNLKKDEYESQYEVMTDIQSLFAAASDNHFDYPPALLNAFLYMRKGLDMVSISANGVSLPQIYGAIDVVRGNKNILDYHASPISDIDGIPIVEWLQKDAVANTANPQDPDAQYNNLFPNVPSEAAGKSASASYSAFEIPDNYTVNFSNGSSLVVHNQLLFLPGQDFSGIKSGKDFHQAFEVPPKDLDVEDLVAREASSASANFAAADKTAKNESIPGFPVPVVKQSYGSIAGYFLEGEGYEDVAVLSILSFLPPGFDASKLANLDTVDYVLSGRDTIIKFFKAAKEAGRDKLILDLSGNGGGVILLAQEVYRLLFPDGRFTIYDRYRATEAVEAAAKVDYEDFIWQLIGGGFPVAPRHIRLKYGENFFGPYTAGGQNVTAPFITNLSQPMGGPMDGHYINGFDPDGDDDITETYFDPEDMLIVTDGTCASACGILTGLLTRTQGIRTLALGGRPDYLPMQAMGGVKGTVVHLNSDIRNAYVSIANATQDDSDASEILDDAQAALPDLGIPPLLPLSGGQVNGRNGYTHDDLHGYPVHFKYEAANCRLFYTQLMFGDPSETWKRAAEVAWNGGLCVHGSTVNEDYTMADTAPAFDSRVKSTVPGLKGPGSLDN